MRIRDWWTRDPAIPDEALASPVRSGGFADEMVAAARRCQSLDERLDLSVPSVEVVDELAAGGDRTPVEVYLLGAYVGEVLRGAAPMFEWAVAPRAPDSPCLALGKQMMDPFELVERYARGRRHPEDSVARAVGEIIEYGADPSGDTAARLGWTTRFVAPTAWESSKVTWAERRRQRARREANKLT